jgi:hypothetical protein
MRFPGYCECAMHLCENAYDFSNAHLDRIFPRHSCASPPTLRPYKLPESSPQNRKMQCSGWLIDVSSVNRDCSLILQYERGERAKGATDVALAEIKNKLVGNVQPHAFHNVVFHKYRNWEEVKSRTAWIASNHFRNYVGWLVIHAFPQTRWS